MTPDALSQEEIDALLKGAGGSGKSSATASLEMTSEQDQFLKKYGDRMATTQGDMVGTFLGETVKVTRKSHSIESPQSIVEKISGVTVLSSFAYEGGLTGKSLLLYPEIAACKIGGTMVGEPEAAEFSDMVMDAFKEVCNTIGGNLNTALSGEVGRSVTLANPALEVGEITPEILEQKLGKSDRYGFITYSLSIGSGEKSDCWQIFSDPLLTSMKALVAPAPSPKAPATQAPPPGPQAAPVEFEPLAQDLNQKIAPPNLDLIMDIALEIRVELGRTNMKIRDVLNLGSGSVVELDKLAGEPVDLLVNEVIFAKGEVVVIDENFGVRITEILTLQERIKTLGELKD